MCFRISLSQQFEENAVVFCLLARARACVCGVVVCVCVRARARAQQDEARPRLYFLLTVPAIFDVYGKRKMGSCFADTLF
jgi:hypothetical protein